MILKDWWILLLLPLAMALVLFLKRKEEVNTLKFPSISLIGNSVSSWKIRWRHLPFFLRLSVIILFFIALSGPRHIKEQTVFKTEGIDIVLAIDASGSMAAEDFFINNQRHNRLDIVKGVVKDFIEERQHDRIGLVVFGNLAYTLCPLTTDYEWLKANLERVELGLVEDGTAIGSGIATSVGRLKQSKAKSKAVILLTDGINNAGKIDPITAASLAKSFGVKVYTIGAGTEGYAPFPIVDFLGRKFYQQTLIEIDEKTLKKIADLTAGRYFRATDTESLKRIYEEINKLEKVKIEEIGFREYTELFGYFLASGLGILILELLLSRTILLKIP